MNIRSIRFAAAILGTCLAISACGGGDSPAAVGAQDVPSSAVTPGSGSAVATTPPAVVTPPVTVVPVTPATPPDSGTVVVVTPPVVVAPAAITIAGTPTTSLAAEHPYSFQPTTSGTGVTFSIAGKPAWASFETASGRLSGTPSASDVGSYGGIVISGSNGASSAALPAFAINVVQTANGSATLSWTPPTANEDGSALTDLAGYKIYFGSDPNALVQSVQITNPGMTTYVISTLSAGTTYFSMTAYTTSGSESARSQVGSKTI